MLIDILGNRSKTRSFNIKAWKDNILVAESNRTDLLKSDMNVDGIEVDSLLEPNREPTLVERYHNPIECPICFLYYPKNINYSECCNQPICTECFTQIKRSENSPTTSPTCPFCVSPSFAIAYVPPPLKHSLSFYFNTSLNDEKEKTQEVTPQTPKSRVSVDEIRHEGQFLLNGMGSAFAAHHTFSPSDIRMSRRRNRHTFNGVFRSATEDPSSNSNIYSGYLAAVRSLGVDIEDVMLAEAIRRSLLETSQSTDNNHQSEGNTPAEGGEVEIQQIVQ